jgi:putative transposase
MLSACIEILNSRFCDEFLNVELFGSLVEAKVLGEDYRPRHNHERLHSSLGEQTPTE